LEYVSFVLITTLLGAAAAGGTLGWRLVLVLIANWLAVAFAFMINDVEDAADDALDPAKRERNPVSAGALSVRAAQTSSYIVAGMAAVLYVALGLWPFVIGLICLTLGYFYSLRGIRLKSIPGADLVSHGLMLAALHFLAGYFTFGGGAAWQWVLPLTFVVAISLYGQLFNELRDLEGDRKAGVTHTASVLGPRLAHPLMMAWFCIGAGSAIGTIVAVRLIPTWVLLVMAGLAAVLIRRPLLRLRRARSSIEVQKPFHKPLEVAAALAMTAWFAGPSTYGVLARLLGPMVKFLTDFVSH
jgi:4-hydroxybenzoate polyprenyltransferase